MRFRGTPAWRVLTPKLCLKPRGQACRPNTRASDMTCLTMRHAVWRQNFQRRCCEECSPCCARRKPKRRSRRAITFGGPPSHHNPGQSRVNTDGNKYHERGVITADTKCEIMKGEALDAQGRALDRVSACLDKLFAFKNAAPQEFKKLGRITEENACAFSDRIGKPTAGASPMAGGYSSQTYDPQI